MLSLSSPSLSKPLLLLSKPTISSTRGRSSLTVCSAATTQRPASTMYEVLAVEETALPQEIRAAYRRQARIWHPDVCPSRDDVEKRLFAQRFMAARQAYELLSDPTRREWYDLGLRSGDAAAALDQAAALRASASRSRSRGRGGFADWDSQLEGLRQRAASRPTGSTWGSRMRRAHCCAPSD